MNPRNIIALVTVLSALAGCTKEELAAVGEIEATLTGKPSPRAALLDVPDPAPEMLAVEEPEPVEPRRWW